MGEFPTTTIPIFFGAALLGYLLAQVGWRERKKRTGEEDHMNGDHVTTAHPASVGMQHHTALRRMILNTTGRGFGVVKRVYVVPGGGPGAAEHGGYPPWTAQRVASALQRYDDKYAETTAFLALGAGSMNAPSPRGDNDHVVFESTKIVEGLVRGGVPPGSILADFASWDTVGNAWFARMAVESLLNMAFRQGDTPDDPHACFPSAGNSVDDSMVDDDRGKVISKQERRDMAKAGRKGGPSHDVDTRGSDLRKRDKDSMQQLPAARQGEAYGGGEMRKWLYQWKAKRSKARKGPLNVTVFVSDFHAARMKAVFEWVFGLEPSLLEGQTTVTTVSLETPPQMWAGSESQKAARLDHEQTAEMQIRLHAAEIRTTAEFQAFLTIGGHKGYFDRTHGKYKVSTGGGWGGTS